MTTKLCPTPWFPIANDYIVRLQRYRRDGAINVEFRNDSPNEPGRRLIVARSRLGYVGFIAAATSLLATSYWDPTCKPGQRARWNPRAVGFSLRTQNVATLAEELPRLLNPKSGRPLRRSFEDERAIIAANGGVRPNNIAARSNRRRELIDGCNKAMHVLDPLRERMQDARRMKGYAAHEVNALAAMVDTAIGSIHALRRAAMTQVPSQQRRIPVTSDEIPTQGTPLSLDEEAFVVEMDRHDPSANLALPAPDPYFTPEFQENLRKDLAALAQKENKP